MRNKEIETNPKGEVKIGGMRNGRRLVEKPKDMGKSIKRLMYYMKSSILLIALVLIASALGTFMQIQTPKLLGMATTEIFKGVTEKGDAVDFNKLKLILLSAAILYVGVNILAFLQQWIMTCVSQKTTKALRKELKKKINTLPVSYFDKNSNGNLMSIAVNDIDNIATTLQQSLTQLISGVITFVGILAIMLTISWQLTFIACVIIPGSFFIVKIFSPIAQKNFREYMKLQGNLNGIIEETYQGHMVVKSFNGEKDAIRKFELYNSNMYESGWRARFWGGSMMPNMMLLKNIGYILIAVFGAIKVTNNSITIGDMQAFLQYSTQFSQPISQFSNIWNGILSTIASAERVFNVLDEIDMEYKKNKIPDNCKEDVKIDFDKISFGYNRDMLMKDFSLEVKSGQMVAIVGHTGAGKSTLINLLERFYEIQGGNIRIDGVDIRNMERSELHANIGTVLQDTWLFSGTIYENIRYGNENASKDEIIDAAKASYVEEFVHKLPDGYDTILNEEASNISQGQRQLITIARAFAANPKILILDEATSNVDSRTEALIQAAMKKLLINRTSFVVAHRLSTIYNADNIVVMKDGAIAEMGKHEELLAAGGVYADIYYSQFMEEYAV
ncbi:ABC transporter ATP-binding protein [Clostridium beijerinckii]|uniref:ABC transporter ATP-binding protein n=1 Tax=Clostridium beijerinckii TaxID=1520 RepID=UPI0017921E7E|nr:ABC transporter ATP-binding protein [Clostridium beijerinckii]NOW05486.1 ATP-binding cassette subfamily B protein [Clostridium beijerinckii]NYC01370.1 ATP-binding cassette subfamily B protein [Clostridium beijerinckii]